MNAQGDQMTEKAAEKKANVVMKKENHVTPVETVGGVMISSTKPRPHHPTDNVTVTNEVTTKKDIHWTYDDTKGGKERGLNIVFQSVVPLSILCCYYKTFIFEIDLEKMIDVVKAEVLNEDLPHY